MTETEIASAGVQPDAAAPFNDREIEFTLTVSEAHARPDVHNRRCFFFTERLGAWNASGRGYKPREVADIVTVQHCLEKGWSSGTIEILRDTPKEPRADGRKSDLAEHFTANFIGLIEASPQNPQVRAHMMKVLKQMPPEELDTFEKLKDWVEQNFEAAAPIPTNPQNGLAGMLTRPPARPQPRIEIEFTASETEVGRCRYEVSRSGTFTHEVTVEELTTWIAEGKDIGEILEAIEERARDSGYDMENYGEYNHDDYEGQESTNHEFERNTSEDRAIERIRDLLSQHAPEALDAMDNN